MATSGYSKIQPRYFLRSFIITVVVTGLTTPVLLLLQADSLADVSTAIATICITFTLTFSAFAVTALTLLQLLQSRDWYASVSGSKYFSSFMSRLFGAVRISLSLLMVSILFRVFLGLDLRPLYITGTSLLVFGMVFSVTWIWDCLTDFIDLFDNHKKSHNHNASGT